MAAIENGGATISGLRGMGGIGKTALALKLAEQLLPRLPDAQFYLDLRGASSHPLSSADAMAHVIRAYRPTEKLPEGEAELSALYRSALHGQHALLLMDNAASREQVEPLIPPASCVLLVTSRHHFTLPGLFAKDLDTLPPEDARALLLTIAPRIGDQADELAKLCGYLPLALRLAGSVLAEHIDLSPTDYSRRLTNARQRLELIDASLSLSYDLLKADEQKLWRVLAVFPDTFDVAAAAAVWEMEIDAAQDAMSKLVTYSMVEWLAVAAQYRLHDLSRLFADARMTEAERTDAKRYHAAHYETVLRSANGLYSQGGQAIKRGLSMFDLEASNIQAGQAWAEALANEDEAAAELCHAYPSAGIHLLNLRLHPRQQIRWCEPALAVARRLKKHSPIVPLGLLGLAYAALGDARRAIEFYEEWLTIAREIGARVNEGNALGSLGNAYKDLGESQRAIGFYEQALNIARETGDRRNEGIALTNLGSAHLILRETRRAIEFYEQRLSIAREIGDRLGEGNALSGLGVAYFDLGETRRAIEFYEQYLNIAREIGDRRGEGDALWNMSLALDELGDRTKAIAHAEAALKIRDEIEDPRAGKVREQLARWR
jgi:tetratricopeptide (TPR) repeat protein